MSEQHPVVIEQASGVMSATDFAASITEAQAKAQTLKSIVESQKLFATISGKKYLEVEAWQTIARAYGLTAKTEWTRPLDPQGWEARAVVIDGTGLEVGAAETECGTVGDSPWDKRNSAAVRSMAQTRAISKALRSVLSWVVVLAGYEPTPANEMPTTSTTGSSEPAPSSSGPSEAQFRRLYAIVRERGVPEDTVRGYIQGELGLASSKDLSRDQYDELVAFIESWGSTGPDDLPFADSDEPVDLADHL